MTVLISPSGPPFLIALASTRLMKTSPNTPPYAIMGEPRLASSSCLHFDLQATSIRYLRNASLGLALLNLHEEYRMASFSMSSMRCSSCCKPMGRYLTPHIDTTHNWVSSQSYMDNGLPSKRYMIHLVHLVASCVDLHLDQSRIIPSIFI